ncbi:transcription termination factor 3, mitochondrial-like isoform X1 [Lineus longissimus]|uniref:transcription termination factor 3, mitochondrial-like isoform X1 n=2 Tax=Lineus longissimus TaxID=88925 RepID=UPI002B4FA36C
MPSHCSFRWDTGVKMIRTATLVRTAVTICRQTAGVKQLCLVPVQSSRQIPVQSSRYASSSEPIDEATEGVKNEEYFRRFVKNRRFADKSETTSQLVSKGDDRIVADTENRGSHIESETMASLGESGGDAALTTAQGMEVIKPENSPARDFGEDIDLDLTNIRPVLKQAGNLAAYVNESETLQKLIKIGVDLHAIENMKEREGADLILQVDFETDVKPRLLWLHSIGVPNRGLGKVITKNPTVLGASLDSMKDNVAYLESKRFDPESIGRIVYKAPKFLTMDVKQADGKLGFYQKEFSLTGPEVRTVTTRLPKLITFPISTAKWCKYTLREFLGFSEAEAKGMFIANPKVLLTDKYRLMAMFDYLYHTMNIPHKQMAEWPQIFRTRVNIIKQRHGFLDKIGRAQYDPTKENYVSLHKLVGNDVTFCKETAKRPLSEFNDYLKSL